MIREGEWDGKSRKVRVVSLGGEDGDIFNLKVSIDAMVLLPGSGSEGLSDCEGGGLVGANRWLHQHTTYRGAWVRNNRSKNGIHHVLESANGCKYVYVDHTLFTLGSVESDDAIRCLEDAVKELAVLGVKTFAINGRRVSGGRSIQFAINRALRFIPNEIEIVYLVDKNNGFGEPGRLSWEDMCKSEYDSENSYNESVRREGFSEIVDILVRDIPFREYGLREILKDRYMRMLKNFHLAACEQEWDQNQGTILPIQRFPDARLMLSRKDLQAELQGRWQYLFDQPCMGVDLPIWFQECDPGYPRDIWENVVFCPNMNEIRQNQPRIMIVSQDPLRNGQGNQGVSLSAPFGLHCGTVRSRADNCISLLVAKLLVELRASVYITDARKLYLCEPAFGSGMKMLRCDGCRHDCRMFCEQNRKNLCSYARRTQEVLKEDYCRILKREISLFRPTLILTMGKVASGMTGVFSDREEGYDELVDDCPIARDLKINGRSIVCNMCWHPSRKRMSAEQKVKYFLKGTDL